MASPLADRLRPQTLDDIVGQQHILGKNKALRRIIESGQIPNLIFYGPSGVGKTTVANIIAKKSGKKLYRMNATTASTADIKEVIESLDTIEGVGGVLLYLDEIQYFNKKQQQILLQYIENGDITLIASTTENPYFYVYNAILSRSTVFEFKQLSAEDIEKALSRAVEVLAEEKQRKITVEESTISKIARSAAGDVRRSLNTLELCVLTGQDSEDGIYVDDACAEQLLAGNSVRYDREGDEHYDVISAYHKSMRGSDPDAAVFYLARLLEAGDLQSACRRLLVCANEDVGLAYPQIIPIVKAAVDTALQVGLPEARIPLANPQRVTMQLTPQWMIFGQVLAARFQDSFRTSILMEPMRLSAVRIINIPTLFLIITLNNSIYLIRLKTGNIINREIMQPSKNSMSIGKK